MAVQQITQKYHHLLTSIFRLISSNNVKQIALPANTVFVAITLTFQRCQAWQITYEKP